MTRTQYEDERDSKCDDRNDPAADEQTVAPQPAAFR
jgi:hypothetical protein